jgi:hypothetical protein
MTKIETSNWDIQLGRRGHSPSRMYQIRSGTQRLRRLSSSVKRTRATFSRPLKLAIREDNPNRAISATVVSDQNINGWLTYVRDEFYSVPVVEAIYVAIDKRDVDIWLIIPKRDFALLRRLVDREMEILKAFAPLEKPPFLFEFHIVYRCGATEGELVPREAIPLSRQQ